jgi:hypothetical protein
VPSRASEASICSMIALRERPPPPGPSCIGKNTLVASTTSSRLVYLRSARPTISSDVPRP